MPIGSKGISMVDIRDIGEAAAIELLRRERSATPLGSKTYALAGPDSLTGEAIAAIWTEALGRPIRYGGDDLTAMEQRLNDDAGVACARPAPDDGPYQSDGAVATADDIARLTTMLSHASRSYHDFAKEAATQWAKG